MAEGEEEENLIKVEPFSSDEEFDDEEGDSESSSDADAKLAEDDVFDIEFLKCYSALKKKDDKIYDKNVKFFTEDAPSSSGDDVDADKEDVGKSLLGLNKKSSKPKVTLLDHQLKLNDDEIEDHELEAKPKIDLNQVVSKSFYEKELEEIKKSIEKVSENIDSESEDDLLIVKGSNQAGISKSKTRKKIDVLLDRLENDKDEDISHLKQIWSDPAKLTDEDKYLRDYILNKRYIPASQDEESSGKGGFFSKNLEELSDVDEEGFNNGPEVEKKKNQVDHRSDEKDFHKITRIPRNSTKTIRDLVEKRKKKEKRLKKLESEKKKRKAIKEADYEDLVGDLPTKFHYLETEPNDRGLSAEELLMATDEELDAICYKSVNKRKKKHKRGVNHKKFAKAGVAPDRLLAYGLSKTKLKKSKLL